jgi:transcription antitermination protein NusB
MAIDILYQADVTERSPRTVMSDWQKAGRTVPTYTETVVAGVERSLPEIDALLAAHSEGWTVHRMAVVDRTILRVACYELRSGLPTAVAINEAVDAAKRLSTDDSGRFINGVLGRIARDSLNTPETEPRA